MDRIDDGVVGLDGVVVLLVFDLGDINWSPPPPCAKENLLFDDDEGVGFGFGGGGGDISWSPPPPFAKEKLLFLEDEDGGGLDGVVMGDGSESVLGVAPCLQSESQGPVPGSSTLEKDSANDSGERKQFPGVNLFFL